MRNTSYKLTALLWEIKWRGRFLRCFHNGHGKRLLAASPLKPFVWKRFIFSLWKIPMEEVSILLTSLTRSTLRSILLAKCHPKSLCFSIQMYSKDLAFQLLEFSLHKPISSPLKLFSMHTSNPATHSLRKRGYI